MRIGLIDRRWRARVGKAVGVAMTAFALLVGAAFPASAAELMRVTFVRHGQSAGNASGLIDTSTPGPVLTANGQQQAQTVVGTLGANNYDAVYASTMVRTQLTAGPMSQFLHLPIQVLPGIQEIEAGVFEGTPESAASTGYGLFPLAWAVQGNRALRIPGSIDGNEFDARMDGALKTIYDNGDRNPVVFSHGGAIMFWTMMNANNLTAAQKIDLLRTAPLSNTNYVVVEGNPEDGWTLVNWNGRLFSPEPTLETEVQRQVRTLVRQLATTANQVAAAFATLNPGQILAAITTGFTEAAYSIAKFATAVGTKFVHELDKQVAGSSATQSVQNVATLKASADTVSSTPPAVTTSASRTATNTNTVTVDAAPTVEATKNAVAVTGESTPVVESTAEKSASSATVKPEAVEAAKVEVKAEPSTATNGATDFTDGNKSVPGGTAPAQSSGADDKTKTPSTTAATTPGTDDAGDGGSQTNAAA